MRIVGLGQKMLKLAMPDGFNEWAAAWTRVYILLCSWMALLKERADEDEHPQVREMPKEEYHPFPSERAAIVFFGNIGLQL